MSALYQTHCEIHFKAYKEEGRTNATDVWYKERVMAVPHPPDQVPKSIPIVGETFALAIQEAWRESSVDVFRATGAWVRNVASAAHKPEEEIRALIGTAQDLVMGCWKQDLEPEPAIEKLRNFMVSAQLKP